MRKFGLFAVLAAAVMASARADVVTNTWITPSGGAFTCTVIGAGTMVFLR